MLIFFHVFFIIPFVHFSKNQKYKVITGKLLHIVFTKQNSKNKEYFEKKMCLLGLLKMCWLIANEETDL